MVLHGDLSRGGGETGTETETERWREKEEQETETDRDRERLREHEEQETKSYIGLAVGLPGSQSLNIKTQNDIRRLNGLGSPVI